MIGPSLRPLQRLEAGTWGSNCGRLLFISVAQARWRVRAWGDQARGELSLACDYRQLRDQQFVTLTEAVRTMTALLDTAAAVDDASLPKIRRGRPTDVVTTYARSTGRRPSWWTTEDGLWHLMPTVSRNGWVVERSREHPSEAFMAGSMLTERRFPTLRAAHEALGRHLAAPLPPSQAQLLAEVIALTYEIA